MNRHSRKLAESSTRTLPKDTNIHAREDQLYLPSKEELQQKLTEWVEQQEE